MEQEAKQFLIIYFKGGLLKHKYLEPIISYYLNGDSFCFLQDDRIKTISVNPIIWNHLSDAYKLSEEQINEILLEVISTHGIETNGFKTEILK